MKITTAIGRWAKFKVIRATNWLEVTVTIEIATTMTTEVPDSMDIKKKRPQLILNAKDTAFKKATLIFSAMSCRSQCEVHRAQNGRRLVRIYITLRHQ